MSRVQLALNVSKIRSGGSSLLQALRLTEPAKRRPGYANFAVVDPPLKLVLIENCWRRGLWDLRCAEPPGRRGRFNRGSHSPPLGRLSGEGLGHGH